MTSTSLKPPKCAKISNVKISTGAALKPLFFQYLAPFFISFFLQSLPLVFTSPPFRAHFVTNAKFEYDIDFVPLFFKRFGPLDLLANLFIDFYPYSSTRSGPFITQKPREKM